MLKTFTALPGIIEGAQLEVHAKGLTINGADLVLGGSDTFLRNSSDRKTGMKDPPASGCGKLFRRDTSPSEGGHRPLCLFNTFITDFWLCSLNMYMIGLVERPTCVKVT